VKISFQKPIESIGRQVNKPQRDLLPYSVKPDLIAGGKLVCSVGQSDGIYERVALVIESDEKTAVALAYGDLAVVLGKRIENISKILTVGIRIVSGKPFFNIAYVFFIKYSKANHVV
jgi:hypothetical protein